DQRQPKRSRRFTPRTHRYLGVGLDVRFIKNRFGIDLTYYDALSTDQIIPVPVSPTTGFTTLFSMLGLSEIEVLKPS
ncbi:MAG: hypothetical protein HC912_10410, partial [Saprospiraceae bacterium]|nr:hypothetical protein [Saprospiraceae bacterium]